MIMRWTNMKCIENYPLYTDPTTRRSSYTYPTGNLPERPCSASHLPYQQKAHATPRLKPLGERVRCGSSLGSGDVYVEMEDWD